MKQKVSVIAESVDTVATVDYRLRLNPPVRLYAAWSEMDECYVCHEPELQFVAYVDDRKELLNQIAEHLSFLWSTYGLANDNTLTADELHLKGAITNIATPDTL